MFITKIEFDYGIEMAIYNLKEKVFTSALMDKSNIEFDERKSYKNLCNNDMSYIEWMLEKQKTEPILFDFIQNVEDKEAFALKLKETFNTERGIDFRIMIELLKDEDIFSFTTFKPFYNAIKEYFNRDIGVYSGVNDKYKHTQDDKLLHKSRIEQVSRKLKSSIL
jgi:hypothetical protein